MGWGYCFYFSYMFNLQSFFLFLLSSWGDGIIINKGNYYNFVVLITLLTVWLLIFTLVINKRKALITTMYNSLACAVLMAFKCKSMILFYIFFELRVIPISLIIILYGYQPEKLIATLALILYTIISRLPLLLYIITIERTITRRELLTIPMTLRFMVKTPIYLLHSWLPKAHVEAPVGGSMFLAGVLLKLGSYGLLLFLPLLKLNYTQSFYFIMGLVGSVVGAVICARQGDMKILIAYSSVVHMGVVTIGFVRGTEIGYSCGLMIIYRHGLVSPFIFSLAFCIYESTHTRLFVYRQRTGPIMILLLLGLVTLNIGIPPRLGLWSEVMICWTALFFMTRCWPILILMFFLRAVYNLYLYVSCFHSKFSGPLNVSSVYIYPILQVVFLTYSSFFCLDLFHLFINFSN